MGFDYLLLVTKVYINKWIIVNYNPLNNGKEAVTGGVRLESVDEGAGDVDGVGVEGVDADDCITVPCDEVGWTHQK